MAPARIAALLRARAAHAKRTLERPDAAVLAHRSIAGQTDGPRGTTTHEAVGRDEGLVDLGRSEKVPKKRSGLDELGLPGLRTSDAGWLPPGTASRLPNPENGHRMAPGNAIPVIGQAGEEPINVCWRDRFSIQLAANHLQPQKVEGGRIGMIGIPCTLRCSAGLDHNGTTRPSPNPGEPEPSQASLAPGTGDLCAWDASKGRHRGGLEYRSRW